MGDQASILATTTGYPFIQIFFNVTGSYSGTNAMTAILIITLTSSCISEIAPASRQLWSFARDNGVPFSSTVARVSQRPHTHIFSPLLTYAGHPRLEHPSQCR